MTSKGRGIFVMSVLMWSLTCLVQAAQYKSISLEKAREMTLRAFPALRFVTGEDYGGDLGGPFNCIGDFDGDGRKDYAFLVMRKNYQRVQGYQPQTDVVVVVSSLGKPVMAGGGGYDLEVYEKGRYVDGLSLRSVGRVGRMKLANDSIRCITGTTGYLLIFDVSSRRWREFLIGE